jgi:hypothetical protein
MFRETPAEHPKDNNGQTCSPMRGEETVAAASAAAAAAAASAAAAAAAAAAVGGVSEPELPS